MARKVARTYARLNISLSSETVGLLDRVTTRGNRSRFIDEAIRERAASVARSRLATNLEEGYAARADRDRAMAEEWLLVDEEVGWGPAKKRAPRRR